MSDYPKPIKRSLRSLADVAYERDLGDHLLELGNQFTRWHEGAIDTWDLSDRIRDFHDGPSRELYTMSERGDPALMVARALVRGLLAEAEVPPEVREAIAQPIAFYKSEQKAREQGARK